MQVDNHKNKVAHENLLKNSDTLFVFIIILGFILEKLIPLTFKEFIPRYICIMLGIIFLFLGISIIIKTKLDFKKHNQSTLPNKAITKLITIGFFKYSRNPLYLSIIIILFGLGIITDILWLIILIPLAIISIQIILIKPEERYLSEKFGENYKKYFKNTRRWI